jgi:RNase adaptor protein for sRNA GlmZ degradation
MTSRCEIETFGFLHGVPLTSSALLVDLRTRLRNPADDPALVDMTGLDEAVRQHVLTTRSAATVIEQTVDQVRTLLAGCTDPRVRIVRLLIGCQGGRHRSVAVGEMVAQALTDSGIVMEITHHHIDRPVVRA